MNKSERAKIIANQLATTRVRHNKSQEYMANELNISRSTVQNWEKAYNIPSFTQMVDWFDILGENIEYQLRMIFHQKMYNNNPFDDNSYNVQDELIKIIKSLDTFEQEQLMYILTSQYGTSTYCILQLATSYCHLSLRSRISIASLIANDYNLEKKLNELLCMDMIQPDIETLLKAIQHACEALKNKDDGYNIIL